MKAAEFQIDSGGKGAVLRLSGDWTTTGLRRLPQRLNRALDGVTVDRVDISDMDGFDTAGALVLVQALDVPVPEKTWKSNPGAGRIYALVERLERGTAETPKRPDAIIRTFSKIGQGVYDVLSEAMQTMAFLGRLVLALGSTLKNPGRIRWAAWVTHVERAGLDAIPIVIATNFFIGAVIAFIGADLLQQFGARCFAVELIGISVFREFAVVITAVLLAGRSSSSFAAEIGSMKMNQEIDAMKVMGVDPFQALVIPRLAALLLMLPLLTFIAVIAGMLGGMLVTWSQLNLGPNFFILRIEQNVGVEHLWVGLSKAPVFAIVVAAIGCRQGMAVSGDVESLGRRVTAAVVQAIFAIIFLDALFALLFMEMGV
ncbi:LOW QUALITY PROTEIN: ABC-type transport system [Brevundimonas abyssalis TAR-001]|uniref:ABC-type transport system n=1 Tax=Brevundimonas abyssalis TAR-001 TaxID=1391729 RepID=A0A8E0NAK9_9CAUL|nr:LOW QUALITY PROTEIN: ABC-type transport system [Brevundimonas abyssalis TAR-001]